MKLSATKLKRYLSCPRSYFLKYVLGTPEDVRGNYLVVGNAFDAAVQAYCSGGQRGVRSIDPRIVRMLDSARPLLPAPGVADVQTEWRLDAPGGGFTVEAKPDLVTKYPDGTWLVQDTKTTAATRPGEGSALDAAGLHADVQARLYAWCAYEHGARAVRAEWLYTSKATRPTSWLVRASWARPELETWFAAVVAPAAAELARLESEVDADRVQANLDSCERCWVRAACDPFTGPNTYDGVDALIPAASLKGRRPTLSAKPKEEFVAFDLKKLSEDVDLVGALEASVSAAKPVRPLQVATSSGVVISCDEIPINPPPARDYHAELSAAVEACRSATARAERLLSELDRKSVV